MSRPTPHQTDVFYDPQAESAIVRLFLGDHASPDVAWFSLPGGRTLYSAGEPADTLYLLRAGRLGVIRREEGKPQQFLGVIKPGEPAGEMALIAGTPHTATVLAMRDSEVLALPRRAFFAAARKDPALMAEMARLTITRARQAQPRTGSSAPTVFALIGVSEGPPIRPMVEKIERYIMELGFTVAVLGAETHSAPTEWFSTVEQRHDIVLFVAERGETSWTHLAARQVDRVLLIGRGDQAPPFEPSAFAGRAIHEHHLMDLILIQTGQDRPRGSAAWLDAAPATRLFHVREGHNEDLRRMARVLSGTSVGLVLSGGGARAYAHIGVIRALREADEPIDFLGGASMGGIIAAGAAMEWDDEEITRRIRHAFVDSSPLSDMALPIIAMTRGSVVKQRLKDHFGDIEIEDLWLPFFCVSSNLTLGDYHLHQRGRLRRALQASSSLPGVMPPVIWNNNVLVDGAVTNNLPTDVMRRWHRGPVVGVDVAVAKALTPEDVKAPASMLRWFLSGEWRKGPPVVSVLMRSASVSSTRDQKSTLDACDLMVIPSIEGVELRDWKAFTPAVGSGYSAMAAALKRLDEPLIDLCRRRANPDELSRHIGVTAASEAVSSNLSEAERN
jgi:NTE family protein